MGLETLLKPKSLAVIGASDRDGFGGDVCRNILNFMGNLERVYFVHPTREEVFGRKCWPNIEAVPDTIDLAIICTSKKIAPANLREAHAKGCRNAVVLASGYRETQKDEDRRDEEELIALCRELDMHVMGPNCGGFVNYIDDVQAFAFVVGQRERKGGIGLLSQSGQVCVSLMDSQSMCFSYVISAGNCAVTSMEEYIDFLVDDPDTKVVSVYLEGVRDVEKFTGALKKAAQKRKPVVILKVGRSEKGRKTAGSHTGSLAGSDRTYDAVFKKFGVIRVNDMAELIAVSELLATLGRLPAGVNMASMNISGGETGIMADVAASFNLSFPDFSPATTAVLRELLPYYATVSNPLDMTATMAYDTDKLVAAYEAILAEDQIHMLILGMNIPDIVTDPANEFMTRACEIVRERGCVKPIVAVPNTESTRNKDYAARLKACGIPILPPVKYAFQALRYLCDFIAYNPHGKTLEVAVPRKAGNGDTFGLSEYESKKLLAATGIPVFAGQIAATAEDAEACAARCGFPAVMKIESPDILHKTDAGCVKLNIKGEREARDAFTQIMGNAAAHNPNADIRGVLVQPMMPPGAEVIVGIHNDPQFGPMLLVGLGGVFVEVFKDTALYPAPLNKTEALDMLKSLKAYMLLCGYRGSKPCDLDALADCMVQISHFAAAERDSIRELDLNPVFVYEQGQGIYIADALIVKNNEA